jgi:hypothetical protein
MPEVRMHVTIPGWLASRFEDRDTSAMDTHEDAEVLLHRLMPCTDERTTSWLARTYAAEDLSAYIVRNGARRMGPRALEYWCMYLGIDMGLRDQWLAAAKARLAAARGVLR